jgi:hypothetical protein
MITSTRSWEVRQPPHGPKDPFSKESGLAWRIAFDVLADGLEVI